VVSTSSGTAPFTYTLSTNPGAPQSSGTFSAGQGSYTITVTDANNCTYAAPATVGFTDNLTLTAGGGAPICAGSSTPLTASGNAASYSWSPATGLSSTTSANPTASPTATTTYTVTATLGSCTKTENVTVTINPSPSINAGPTQSIYSGGNVILQASASGASSYAWTPSGSLNDASVLNPIASPTVTTLYTLTATNAAGCQSTDTVSVIVIPYCIMVKNAFSPNGDGLNDKWKVYDDFGCLKNVTVHVYNRYGNKVFESRDYRNDWDGSYKGKPVPDGTYYAVIEFTLITGKISTQRSDVTIIR
jgi:gliding motility-associated-like protein